MPRMSKPRLTDAELPLVVEVNVAAGDCLITGTLTVRQGRPQGRPRLAPDETKPKKRAPMISSLTGRRGGRPAADFVALIRRLGAEGGGRVDIDVVVEHAIACGYLLPAQRGSQEWTNRRITVTRALIGRASQAGVGVATLGDVEIVNL
jgi:hypothetical protein